MMLVDKDEAYENLATAIVAQAVKDYILAREQQDALMMYSIRRFFYSEYFQMLVSIDPDLIIGRLESKKKLPRIDIDDIFKRR